jgi:hypothetical protein
MDDQFDVPLLPESCIPEEAFLKELDQSINPFLRGELHYCDYVEGKRRDVPTDCSTEEQLPTDCSTEEQMPNDCSTEVQLPTEHSGEEKLASNRFANDSDDVEEWMTPFVPRNTRKNTKWALSNFNAWCKHYNSTHKNVCPKLEEIHAENELCRWLTCFILGTRTTRGQEYSPKTLIMLLAGLYRHMAPSDERFNFMNKRNPVYRGLWSACDRLFRQLREKGVGAKPKSAPIISSEEDDILWKKGILGIDTPKGLFNAVFYLNGKNFHLRGEEHKFLQISQVQYFQDPERYEYVEGGSKNHCGGLQEITSCSRNKVVPILANPQAGSRCHVHVLNLYLSKIPPQASQHDFFYLHPVKEFSAEGHWYTTQVIEEILCRKWFRICLQMQV